MNPAKIIRPLKTPGTDRPFARHLRVGLVLVPILFSAACASIVSDNETTTYIATQPEAARCELRGDNFSRVVNTPASLTLPAKATPIIVTCGAEGFRQTSRDMATTADGWIMGNLIFGGLIGVAVDAARGAGQKFPSEMTVVLEPEAFDSPEARDGWYDQRRQIIEGEWDGAIETIDSQCSRSMKDLCTEKRKEAESSRDEELDALEQRRLSAVVANAGQPD